MDAVAPHAEGVLVKVRAQPRASRSEVQGVVEGRLRVRLAAPPVDGAANDALVRLLAEVLGVARGRVEVTAGQSSRLKTVLVRGLAAETVLARLAAAGAR